MNEVAVKPDLDGLRMVVEAVRNAPDEQFSMGVWYCDTAACAIGWFCHSHPADPLKLHVDHWDGRAVPKLGNNISFEAIETRFGIDWAEAESLFGEYETAEDNSRAAVIARIEQFIREHEAA